MPVEFILCFIDDILVFTPNNVQSHLQQLEEAFKRINSSNLRIKLGKYQFASAEVPFLEHIVSREQLKMDPSNIKALFAHQQKNKYPV